MSTDDDPKGPTAMAITTSAAPAAPVLDAERTELLAALAEARTALVRSVEGLEDAQAGERPTVSALCLGGLVKHVTSTERSWLRFALEGSTGTEYELPDGVSWAELMSGTASTLPQWMIDRENDFAMLPGDTLAGILADYEQVAARTAEIVATTDLSISHPLPEAPWHEAGASMSLRGVLLHVIIETAQHAGHADILRESLDGGTAT